VHIPLFKKKNSVIAADAAAAYSTSCHSGTYRNHFIMHKMKNKTGNFIFNEKLN
jgi:cation transporter-like permease